ncbi:MAG TPA: hypothetical protein VD994_11040 [Prosthecobacter sp.]|nr:hypothetical protein [Prosthecobacter sp.]
MKMRASHSFGNPTRRAFCHLSLLSGVAAVISNCAGTSTSGPDSPEVTLKGTDADNFVLNLKARIPEAKLPLPASLERFFSLRQTKRITVDYSGSVTLPRRDGDTFYANDSRTGNLGFRATFTRVSRGGEPALQIEQSATIGGVAADYNSLPSLMFPPHFTFKLSPFADYIQHNGIGAPLEALRLSSGGTTIRMGRAGSVSAPTLAGAVPAWRWSYRNVGSNSTGQTMVTEYLTTLSDGIPGMLHSMLYQQKYNDAVAGFMRLAIANITYS